jgi:hypothetical protein
MSALNSTSTATATHARARKPARKREKEKRGEGKRGRRRVTRAAYLSPFPAWASKGKDAMVCAVCVRTADWKPRGSRSEAEEGALLRRCHPGQRLEEVLRGEYSTSKSKQAQGQNAGSQSFFLPACFPRKAARERGSTTRGCSRHTAEARGDGPAPPASPACIHGPPCSCPAAPPLSTESSRRRSIGPSPQARSSPAPPPARTMCVHITA